jgi:hypothetical protein
MFDQVKKIVGHTAPKEFIEVHASLSFIMRTLPMILLLCLCSKLSSLQSLTIRDCESIVFAPITSVLAVSAASIEFLVSRRI